MTPADSRAHATLNHFLATLAHMGWGLGRGARPQDFDAPRSSPLAGAAWVSLARGDSQDLLLVALATELPDPGEAFRRYEDLSPAHRELLRELRGRGLRVPYVALLGERGAQLIDAAEEDLLLSADSRDDMDARLLPILDAQALARGSLVSFPRKSLRQRGRELSDWTRLWSARIGGQHDISRRVMERFFEWLLLARLASLIGIGPIAADAFESHRGPHTVTSARKLVEESFRALHDQWFLLQDSPLKPMLEIVAESARSGELGQCLDSLALLSRAKFSAEVFADAFADEELRLLSWRQAITGSVHRAAPAEEPHAYSDSLLREVRTIQLDDIGTIGLLKEFDRLVERVQRESLDRISASERGERPGLQLDLLAEEPEEYRPEESARYVLRRLLRTRTTWPERAALARMILLARCAEWDRTLHAHRMPFPRIGIDLQPSAAPRPDAPPPISIIDGTSNYN